MVGQLYPMISHMAGETLVLLCLVGLPLRSIGQSFCFQSTAKVIALSLSPSLSLPRPLHSPSASVHTSEIDLKLVVVVVSESPHKGLICMHWERGKCQTRRCLLSSNLLHTWLSLFVFEAQHQQQRKTLLQLKSVFNSVAMWSFKEGKFGAVWALEGSNSNSQSRHVSNSTTNSWSECLWFS